MLPRSRLPQNWKSANKEVKIYDDYKAAMAEVKRLNAAERERQHEV